MSETRGAPATRQRHQVVVIGSGFGGLTATQRLKHLDVDIKLISRTAHHLFQPLLYQVATGIISQGEVAPQTRTILRNQRNAEVLLGEVVRIDLAGQYVISESSGQAYKTDFDTLILAAGASQSYFGNDDYAQWAPGMKTIDDALELRGRMLGAFEQAERSDDPTQRQRLLTFTVVGAGPTGVEMAGQIAVLAYHTLKGAFRHIDTTEARVILIDAAPAVLRPMGETIGRKTMARLEKIGVEIQLDATVTDVDRNGLTVTDSDGTMRRIESACKVWSAGVSASSLGKQLADQSSVAIDSAGRVKVLPDLSIPGYPKVFVIGDMATIDGVPGLAQGAIQGAKYVANAVKSECKSVVPTQRRAFQYCDKGSMATVSRFSAVAKIGSIEFGGFIAWLAWLALHLVTLVGFNTKVTTLLSWAVAFLSTHRGQLTITEQQAYVRTPIEAVDRGTHDGPELSDLSVHELLKTFIAVSPLPPLQSVVAKTENAEQTTSRRTFWGFLAGLLLVGSFLDSLPDSANLLPKWPALVWLVSQTWLMDLLNKLGDAAIIAAILAVAVDKYVKQKLVSEVAREAVDFAVGYALPPEVKKHVQYILRMPFVRRNLVFTYEFGAISGANADEYLKVKCTTTYEIVNLTDRDIKFNVRTAVQNAHYPGLEENKLSLLKVADRTRSETELKELADKQAKKKGTTDVLYTSVTEEVEIPHGHSNAVPVVTERISYVRRDDDIFLDILPPPSLGLTLRVKGLADYVVGASFGASGMVPGKYASDADEWTWTVTDVVLPGSHFYLKWHPQ
ncbi:NAD(P)/FAD-dependent oxidoreductase [Mycolicibacterium sp. P1-5]|nr:NAD(P)/FAD-dependent oxidoreductase [Mycolicibacterium sp. P1-5]